MIEFDTMSHREGHSECSMIEFGTMLVEYNVLYDQKEFCIVGNNDLTPHLKREMRASKSSKNVKRDHSPDKQRLASDNSGLV